VFTGIRARVGRESQQVSWPSCRTSASAVSPSRPARNPKIHRDLAIPSQQSRISARHLGNNRNREEGHELSNFEERADGGADFLTCVPCAICCRPRGASRPASLASCSQLFGRACYQITATLIIEKTLWCSKSRSGISPFLTNSPGLRHNQLGLLYSLGVRLPAVYWLPCRLLALFC
jgi:hypothetical protein